MARFKRIRVPHQAKSNGVTTGNDPHEELAAFVAPILRAQRTATEAIGPEKNDGTIWMTVVQAARYAGFPCKKGRAPNSFYKVAEKIGYLFHGRWLMARDDLDEYIRGERSDWKSP